MASNAVGAGFPNKAVLSEISVKAPSTEKSEFSITAKQIISNTLNPSNSAPHHPLSSAARVEKLIGNPRLLNTPQAKAPVREKEPSTSELPPEFGYDDFGYLTLNGQPVKLLSQTADAQRARQRQDLVKTVFTHKGYSLQPLSELPSAAKMRKRRNKVRNKTGSGTPPKPRHGRSLDARVEKLIGNPRLLNAPAAKVPVREKESSASELSFSIMRLLGTPEAKAPVREKESSTSELSFSIMRLLGTPEAKVPVREKESSTSGLPPKVPIHSTQRHLDDI